MSALRRETAYIASVRPNDAAHAVTGRPLARVRYTDGSDSFTAWRHVPHAALPQVTGMTLEFWQRIDRYAHIVVASVRALVADGSIPAVTSFAELHDHFDANTGWSEEIDALPPQEWNCVQWRVTDILRVN